MDPPIRGRRRAAKAVGLDARNGQQVEDELLHPPRLALDDRQKTLAGRQVGFAIHILQRLDIAEDSRERGTKLVACVGDEIRSHPVGGVDRRAVGQEDDPVAARKRGDPHRPALAGAREIGVSEAQLGLTHRSVSLGLKPDREKIKAAMAAVRGTGAGGTAARRTAVKAPIEDRSLPVGDPGLHSALEPARSSRLIYLLLGGIGLFVLGMAAVMVLAR